MNPCVVIKNKNLKKSKNITFIYSHGNSSDIGGCLAFSIMLSYYFNVNVVIYDYIGYGLSTGQPSEQKIYDDLENVLAFTNQHLKIPLHKIWLWGYSLGSGPTIHIASRYEHLAGIVLLAPIASCLLFLDKKLD